MALHQRLHLRLHLRLHPRVHPRQHPSMVASGGIEDKVDNDHDDGHDLEYVDAATAKQREEELLAERRRKRKAIIEKHRQKEQQRHGTSGTVSAAHSSSLSTATTLPTSSSRITEVDYKVSSSSSLASIRSRNYRCFCHGPAATPASVIHDKEEADEGSEDVFDMFGDSDVKVTSLAAKHALTTGDQDQPEHDESLQANWDDHEGYYHARAGEMIAGRYKVLGVVGKGVFSTVLRCVDTLQQHERQQQHHQPAFAGGMRVAIKMVRNNDVMAKAAETEVSILQRLAQADPKGRRHRTSTLQLCAPPTRGYGVRASFAQFARDTK